jgi:hypothetical protein
LLVGCRRRAQFWLFGYSARIVVSMSCNGIRSPLGNAEVKDVDALMVMLVKIPRLAEPAAVPPIGG